MRSGTRSPTEPEISPQVAIIGAGAVGLTLAGRLAQHGVGVALFEQEPEPRRIGSKAICMQRETLEIWERLGVGERVAERGIQWRIGRTYHRGRQLFEVELPTHAEHFPPFVNISQSEVEELLEARLAELGVRVGRGQRCIGIQQDDTGVTVSYETDAGPMRRRFAYLVGTDGAHSTVRHAAGIGFDGYTFEDRFLIADVRAELPFSNERHFHFDPPWNPGRQVLIHPQPDGIWRIDWQVPPETDADAERASGALDRRIRAVIGERTPYELVWLTAYRFSQRVADRFRDGRIFLAGDAAHVMSPFGARGLNSGVADAENLAWRLAWVLRRGADPSLLDAYEAERRGAALENLAATDATMRFLAPHSTVRRAWRDLVLRLAPHSGWFRRRVNPGRLAEPARYPATGPEDPRLPRHGTVAPDLAQPGGSRLRERLGSGFVLLATRPVEAPVPVVVTGTGTAYGDERAWLVRPDGYLAGSVELEAGPPAIAELLKRVQVADQRRVDAVQP
ncbi:MAG TPA: FAD-dependent monooxygenase [Patescibacteria group bacterium]|nr:FAD-dependent monooxygenase [Patescibacteria group bacterium]